MNGLWLRDESFDPAFVKRLFIALGSRSAFIIVPINKDSQ